MILAEIKGKIVFDEDSTVEEDSASMGSAALRDLTRMEDLLTSNVFQILKNAEPALLNALLEVAGIPSFTDKQKTKFEFWGRFDDETEPDVMIENEQMLVVIEVKYRSPFDKGTSKRAPQVIREIRGAKQRAKGRPWYLLGVTMSNSLDWFLTVPNDYQEEIRENLNQLRSLSWNKIHEVISKYKDNLNINPVTKNFLEDLFKYFEFKEFGFSSPEEPKGKRDFLSIFGDSSAQLFQLVKKYNFNIVLSKLTLEEKRQLYEVIQQYIINSVDTQRLYKIDNTLSIDTIPVDLIFGVEDDELENWFRFISFLYKNEYICLNGKADFSAKLFFLKGAITKTPVSLFRYRKAQRVMEFQERR